jgi:hypothetical protein
MKGSPVRALEMDTLNVMVAEIDNNISTVKIEYQEYCSRGKKHPHRSLWSSVWVDQTHGHGRFVCHLLNRPPWPADTSDKTVRRSALSLSYITTPYSTCFRPLMQGCISLRLASLIHRLPPRTESVSGKAGLSHFGTLRSGPSVPDLTTSS